MKRFVLFAAGLAVVVAGVLSRPGAAQGQAGTGSGLRLTLVGIAFSDFAKSQAFYEKVMGFPVAFKFSSADGTRTNLFFQMGRDSFMEMQQATADVRPGLNHVHFVVDDLTATLARLRQGGLVAPQPKTQPANAVTEAGYSKNIFVRNANVYDPNGIRLELNEHVPESLMKKATESWTAAQEARGLNLNVIGVAAKDVPESDRFYQNLLGFRVAFTFGSKTPTRSTEGDKRFRHSCASKSAPTNRRRYVTSVNVTSSSAMRFGICRAVSATAARMLFGPCAISVSNCWRTI